MSAKPQTMSTRASIMLAGEQSTRIDVHGARENGARLALLWGTLLLTFTAADQVHALLTAYTDARPGSQRLPAEVNPAILSANVGDEAYVPTIALTYRDVPRCTVTVHAAGPDSPGGWAHPQRFLHINAGVVLFRIFDQAAYTSTVAVLTNAADLPGAHARLRRVLRSCPPAVPGALPAGPRKGWTGQRRDIQDQEGDIIMPICAPCRVPHGVEQCEDTQAGRCGVTRACYCQHKTHPVNTTEVSPGPERETSAENGTGRVGTIRHTAENEGRTPR